MNNILRNCGLFFFFFFFGGGGGGRGYTLPGRIYFLDSFMFCYTYIWLLPV